MYGELRNSVSSIYNAYQMANIIDKSLVSDAELAKLEADLGSVLPWAFSGYFGYVMA